MDHVAWAVYQKYELAPRVVRSASWRGDYCKKLVEQAARTLVALFRAGRGMSLPQALDLLSALDWAGFDELAAGPGIAPWLYNALKKRTRRCKDSQRILAPFVCLADHAVGMAFCRSS